MAENWIDKVYAAKDRAELDSVYHQWADEYDRDLAATGYLHTPVMMGLVARRVPRRDAAILDVGVGTGSMGSLLSLLGYNNLHGLDMSEAMLAKARARKCYADLTKTVLGEALPFTEKSFDAVISMGTFTTGHAPASAFDELVRILEPGGILISTFGTVVWEEQGFRTKLDGLVKDDILERVEVTPIYRPMPFSEIESGFTTRAHVYRRA
jgi:ubiquinone/menaquinone biosynthesis C-methylase UbiE